jgi:hypothetical protein
MGYVISEASRIAVVSAAISHDEVIQLQVTGFSDVPPSIRTRPKLLLRFPGGRLGQALREIPDSEPLLGFRTKRKVAAMGEKTNTVVLTVQSANHRPSWSYGLVLC